LFLGSKSSPGNFFASPLPWSLQPLSRPDAPSRPRALKKVCLKACPVFCPSACLRFALELGSRRWTRLIFVPLPLFAPPKWEYPRTSFFPGGLSFDPPQIRCLTPPRQPLDDTEMGPLKVFPSKGVLTSLSDPWTRILLFQLLWPLTSPFCSSPGYLIQSLCPAEVRLVSLTSPGIFSVVRPNLRVRPPHPAFTMYPYPTFPSNSCTFSSFSRCSVRCTATSLQPCLFAFSDFLKGTNSKNRLRGILPYFFLHSCPALVTN